MPPHDRGVDADVVDVVVQELREVVEAGAVLTGGERDAGGLAQRSEQVRHARRERVLQPREVEVLPLTGDTGCRVEVPPAPVHIDHQLCVSACVARRRQACGVGG